MFSVLLCLAGLIPGYLIYGRVVERLFGIDPSRKTPALTRADGVDYVPPSERGHGGFCKSLTIRYHLRRSVETQAFFGHVSTPRFITH